MTQAVLTVRVIVQAVAAAFEVTGLDILSERRTAAVLPARFGACWLARRLTPLSLPEIGRSLGGRDHTTILKAVERAEEMRAADPAYALTLDTVAATLALLVTLPPGGVDPDPVAAARRILADPLRNATRISTAETIAMARLVLDLIEPSEQEQAGE